jgi:hypothetical protein
MTGSPGVDRVAVRLGSALVGIMSLEGALFRQIIPIAIAGALAAWDAIGPGTGPAPWVVRRFGYPPRELVPFRDVRIGQGVVAGACVVAVALQAANGHPASWIVGGCAGAAGIAASIVGRPSLGLGGRRHHGGPEGPPR